jgi:hypothetical protein
MPGAGALVGEGGGSSGIAWTGPASIVNAARQIPAVVAAAVVMRLMFILMSLSSGAL